MLYASEGKWFFLGEDDSEYGPYDTKVEAREAVDAYCCIVLQPCSNFPFCSHNSTQAIV